MNQALLFFDYLNPGNHEYVELRIKTNFDNWQEKKAYYTQFENFKKLYPEIITRKGLQFFIKNKEQMRSFVGFNDGWFMKNVRVFYGASKRIKIDGDITGGYLHIRNVEIVYFDIDRKDHETIEEWERKFFDAYISSVIGSIEKYGLYYPTIVHSGSGKHLLYKIEKKKITDGRKRWFKDFMEMVVKDNVSDKYEIDAIKDFTRVLGLPGSMNVKRGSMVNVEKWSEEVNDFKIRSKQKPKININPEDIELPEIFESLEWKIITHPRVPKGSVHRVLLFALKLLLKAHGVKDWSDYQNKMNAVRKTNHRLNPYYGTDNKNYSPGIIINWCKEHEEWCEKEGINFKEFI